AVVVGKPTPAIVEGDHAARVRSVMRKGKRERFEIGRRARKTRQADHRRRSRAPLAIAACVQPQAVRCCDEDAGGAVLHGALLASPPGLSHRAEAYQFTPPRLISASISSLLLPPKRAR